MSEHEKSWVFTFLTWLGTVFTWVFEHNGIVLTWACGLASIVACLFAIRASRASARLAKLKTDYLVCNDCIDGLPPEECPHPNGRRPKLCPKQK
jgi:hypothetical protein